MYPLARTRETKHVCGHEEDLTVTPTHAHAHARVTRLDKYETERTLQPKESDSLDRTTIQTVTDNRSPPRRPACVPARVPTRVPCSVQKREANSPGPPDPRSAREKNASKTLS